MRELINKIIKLNKKRKGFTLVEILITIALIGLLFGIGIPGIMKISESMKKRSFETKTRLVEQAAILWGEDNKTLLQSHECDIDGDGIKETKCYQILITDLISDDYLDSEKKIVDDEILYKNPMDGKNISGKCVFVYKKNNRIYSMFSLNNSCIITSPKFKAYDNINSNQIHDEDFNLEIINPNLKSLNYKIMYDNGDGSGYVPYLDKINIKSNKTINAKVCNQEETVCSNEVEYIAKIIKKPKFYVDGNEVSETKDYYKNIELLIKDPTNTTDYEIKYKINNNIEETYSDKVQIKKDAKITAFICNNENECGKETILNVNINLNPPKFISDKQSGEVNYDNFDLSIEEDDYYNDVIDYPIEYSYDKNTWIPYSEPLNISTNGIIYARISNNNGEFSEKVEYDSIIIKSPIFKVDGNTVNNSGIYYDNVTINIENPNASSLNYKVQYKIGDSSFDDGNIANITETKTITARICNQSNKCGEEVKYNVTIKKLGNVIISADDGLGSGSWHNKEFTLNVTADNADTLQYKTGSTYYNMTTNNNSASYKVSPSSSGKYDGTIKFRAKLGSKTSPESYYIARIDTKNPEITLSGMTNYIDKKIYKYKLKDKISGLNSYKISTNIACNDNSSWKKLSGTEKEVSLTFENNATYYLCVKDNAENISKLNITISGIISEFDYNFSCVGKGDVSQLSYCTGETYTYNLRLYIYTNIPLTDDSYVIDCNGTETGNCNTRIYYGRSSFQEINAKNSGYNHKYEVTLDKKKKKKGYNYYNVTINLCDEVNGCSGEIKESTNVGKFTAG